MWKKGKLGDMDARHRNTARGRLLVHKSPVTPGQWVWDAVQDQPDLITPPTHRKTGKCATMREAKEAAEHALAHMIATNP